MIIVVVVIHAALRSGVNTNVAVLLMNAPLVVVHVITACLHQALQQVLL